MFLYTNQPVEMIFPPDDLGYTQMNFKGRDLSVVEVNGKKVISRLISTNQRDFLNPDFFPGKELS